MSPFFFSSIMLFAYFAGYLLHRSITSAMRNKNKKNYQVLKNEVSDMQEKQQYVVENMAKLQSICEEIKAMPQNGSEKYLKAQIEKTEQFNKLCRAMVDALLPHNNKSIDISSIPSAFHQNNSLN